MIIVLLMISGIENVVIQPAMTHTFRFALAHFMHASKNHSRIKHIFIT